MEQGWRRNPGAIQGQDQARAAGRGKMRAAREGGLEVVTAATVLHSSSARQCMSCVLGCKRSRERASREGGCVLAEVRG